MQTNEKIYQSILHKISIIPPSHLQELDIYLQKMVLQVEKETGVRLNAVFFLKVFIFIQNYYNYGQAKSSSYIIG
jgi:hypothetical protein